MEIRKPTWYWNGLCPCCGQGDALVMVSCCRCGHIALRCGETTLTAFPEPRDLTVVTSGDSFCIACGSVVYDDFEIATAEAILRSGFDRAEYH